MHKGSIDQDNPAERVDHARQTVKKSAGKAEKTRSGKTMGDAAAGKKASAPRATKVNKKWLSEIAKTAASVRWKRGD